MAIKKFYTIQEINSLMKINIMDIKISDIIKLKLGYFIESQKDDKDEYDIIEVFLPGEDEILEYVYHYLKTSSILDLQGKKYIIVKIVFSGTGEHFLYVQDWNKINKDDILDEMKVL